MNCGYGEKKSSISPSKRIPIRLYLEGEEVERFLSVKRSLGSRLNTETIRLLISKVYQDFASKYQTAEARE